MTPKENALLSVIALVVGSALGAGAVALSIHFGFFMWFAYGVIAYTIVGLCNMIYKIELHRFECIDRKKG